MFLSSRFTFRSLVTLVTLVLCLCWLSTANAEAVNFSNLSQSGQGPGDPSNPFGTPEVNGNSLDFTDPVSFSATAGGGVVSDEDNFTDGFLSFTVTAADSDTWITGLSVSELGARILLDVGGNGTSATAVNVIAVARIVVTELDHGSTPLSTAAANPIDFGFNHSFNLDDFPGSDSWAGSDFQNIAAILADRGVSFDQGVTKFNFFLNNQLAAFSEGDTSAFIGKEGISFDVTTQAVPEPSSFLLLVGMLSMTCVRRKRNA